MLASRMTMKNAPHNSASAHHRCGLGVTAFISCFLCRGISCQVLETHAPAGRARASDGDLRRIVDELVELDSPAARVARMVLGAAALRGGERGEPALHHTQPRAVA